MAPPTWGTPEQTGWLQSWFSSFIQRQAEHKLDLFWPPMYEAWFKDYPERTCLGLPLATERDWTEEEMATLSEAIKTRKGQLYNWFFNQRKKVGNATNPATTNSAMVQNIFRLGAAPKKRVHHSIEVFQQRNQELINDELKKAGYDLLNKRREPDSKDDWTDESEDTPEARKKRGKSARMRLRTRVVRDLFNAASSEELEAIQETVEAEREKKREEALSAEKRPKVLASTPAERQQAIDALDALLSETLRATYRTSGWVGMTVVGGPNPRMNGDLTLKPQVKVICFGQTPAGNDFEACCVDFDKNLIQPFQDFLRICFGNEDTASLALPQTMSAPTMDDTPVHRIATTEPVAEPENAKKSKPKQKKKQKKQKQTEGHAHPVDDAHAAGTEASVQPSSPP
ncbi:hypothetical protein B0H14DRAFT_3431143 [Mycena olivaceomarginata]|nr:hypothetical protein B0H14DRAFT_3431143 [Mycena olivaceomarginata]